MPRIFANLKDEIYNAFVLFFGATYVTTGIGCTVNRAQGCNMHGYNGSPVWSDATVNRYIREANPLQR